MKQLLGTAVLLVSLVGMSMGGVWAVFSDTETSLGNTVDTGGSPDLWLLDGTKLNEGITETWVMNNMKPGMSEYSHDVQLRNKSADEALAVKIDWAYTEEEVGSEESDTAPDSAAGMARFIQVTLLTYRGNPPGDPVSITWDLLWTGPGADVPGPGSDQDNPATPWNEIDDVNGNGWVDLEDLKRQPLRNLWPVPWVNSERYSRMEMALKFHADAGNDYQGDRVTLTGTFTLHD